MNTESLAYNIVQYVSMRNRDFELSGSMKIVHEVKKMLEANLRNPAPPIMKDDCICLGESPGIYSKTCSVHGINSDFIPPKGGVFVEDMPDIFCTVKEEHAKPQTASDYHVATNDHIIVLRKYIKYLEDQNRELERLVRECGTR